jgi:hypothetical protein
MPDVGQLVEYGLPIHACQRTDRERSHPVVICSWAYHRCRGEHGFQTAAIPDLVTLLPVLDLVCGRAGECFGVRLSQPTWAIRGLPRRIGQQVLDYHERLAEFEYPHY